MEETLKLQLQINSGNRLGETLKAMALGHF